MKTSRTFGWIMALAFGASSAFADTSNASKHKTAPHKTASHKTASHETAPHETASHETASHETRQATSHHSDTERSTARDAQGKLSAEQITELQRKLTARGFYHDEINGHFGPKTRRALREYQQSRKLAATARVDQQTANALGMRIGAVASENSAKAAARVQVSPVREKSVELTALDKDQIRELQKKLRATGYYDAEPDGTLGPTTRSALEQYFRSQAALVAEGRLGEHALSSFGIRPSEVKTTDQGGSPTTAATQ